MSVKYNVAGRVDLRDPSLPKKFYASIKRSETVDLDNMVEIIADYSTVNPPDIMAVLESLIRIIPKQLLNGRGVNFGTLGSFYLTVKGDGAETEEDVNETNIRSVKLRFLPSKKLKNQFKRASFEKVG